MKKLIVTTAVTALTIGAAAAPGTTTTPRPGPGSAPAATPSTPPPAAKSTAMSKPASNASAAKFINSQQSDRYLASKLKGADVLGADKLKIFMTEDELTQAENFEPYNAASSTTGIGSSRPAPGGSRPSPALPQ